MNDNRSSARTFALVVGAVFLLVGILGFIPGVTTNYSDMTFAGHEGDTALLGIFDVNILHNVVHLLFGVLGLIAARSSSVARTYLIAGGATYLVVWLYGILVDGDSAANIININGADNALHLFLGLGMLGLGLISGAEKATDRRRTATA
jgi:hypothetical protein